MFKRDHITSLQSDNVENIGEKNNLLMIEAELKNNNKTIGQLKDDSVYLLNYAKHIMQDWPNESVVDDDNKKDKIVENINKRKYEQDASEFKKLLTSIKTVVRRNIAVLSEQEYDHFRIKYGKFMNDS